MQVVWLIPSYAENPTASEDLIIHGASLLTSWPQTALWRQVLNRLDFLVAIDRQLTADAAYADIILPATTMFEIESYMVYGPIFRLREKIIEPVGEARNDYLIMAELTHHLGYGHLYPQSEAELICFALKDSGYSLEDIKEAGGWIKIRSPMMQYKKWERKVD